jgi:hypothetical protein
LPLACGVGRPVVDRVRGRAVRRLADEHAVHRRSRLQPSSCVDDVPCDHRLARSDLRAARDQRLACVDGDANVYLRFRQHIADRERCAHGGLRIVLVRDRRAEDGHDGIADELLDRAAVTLEFGAKSCVIGGERCAHVLRVPSLGLRGRADEVGEQNRHDLALFEQDTDGRGQRGSATRTESRSLRAFPPARLAHDHIHGYRLGAYRFSGDLGSLRRT